MSDDTTSLVARDSPRRRISSIREQAQDFVTFLRQPVLPQRARKFTGRTLAAIGRMLVIDLLVMAVLVTLASIVIMAGIDLPDTALEQMEITAFIAVTVVIAAPLVEEIVFRVWLSGRPGHVIPLAILGLGILVMTQTDLTRSMEAVNVRAIGAALLTLAGAVIALYMLRGRPAMDWFASLFPLFFWGSAVAFAAVHLLNFDEGSLWVLLPLVLPQFVVGTMLGYLRVHYGLVASIMLHALHNGLLLGLVYTGLQMAD